MRCMYSKMLLLILIIIVQFCNEVHLANDTLILVHVIGRHCDRTPDPEELHLKNPYHNESNFAPYGYGQLTNEGKRKCYEIGRALRQRYDGFLDSTYHYSLVEGRSSSKDRTKESLQLLLAGLFPPTKELIWLEGMNWLPFATIYDKKEEDELLYSWETERHQRELEIFKQTQESKAFSDPFEDLVKYVSQQYEDSLDYDTLAFLTRGFELSEVFGLPLPDWLKSVYPYPLKHIIGSFIDRSIGNKRLLRICGGYLLKKIVEDSEMKINRTLDPINRKLFIYSAHDISLIPLLAILDIWDHSTVPPPGSYSIFEIHNINGTYGFKFFNFHNGSEAQIMNIPGFGEFVPFDDFKIRKREFLDLEDLDEPSFSTRFSGNLFYVGLLPLLLLQFTF